MGLAGLSLALLLWQWIAARRFPLHRRQAYPAFAPGVTILKPIKGADARTASCLRSWLTQDYPGPVQVLFGVASESDPACAVVRQVLSEHPERNARLLVCPENLGVNAKVSKLVQLFRQAEHDILIVSDADVRVPPDFLASLMPGFREEAVGLLNCFYEMATPATAAMRWEAVAVNADFWSQVLQSRTLKPLDFALGAVMAVRREALERIGGFAALADHLADDYHLGHRVSKAGWRIELCTVPVECLDAPAGWVAIWRHQLRWSRTIRVCQPVPYFFSVLSNPTFWPLLWALARPGQPSLTGLGVALALRMILSADLQHQLTRKPLAAWQAWMAPVKDLLQMLVWLAAFAGNSVEWRGVRYTVGRDGRLEKMD